VPVFARPLHIYVSVVVMAKIKIDWCFIYIAFVSLWLKTGDRNYPVIGGTAIKR
jgi:hypothetical protein